MSQFLIDRRLTHEEARQATAPLALDLTALFKVMEEEFISELNKARRDGLTPEAAIDRALTLFDPKGPEGLVEKKAEPKHEIGDKKRRDDGTWWEKTGIYSWKKIRAPEGEEEEKFHSKERTEESLDEIWNVPLDLSKDTALRFAMEFKLRQSDPSMSVSGMTDEELISELKEIGIHDIGDHPIRAKSYLEVELARHMVSAEHDGWEKKFTDAHARKPENEDELEWWVRQRMGLGSADYVDLMASLKGYDPVYDDPGYLRDLIGVDARALADKTTEIYSIKPKEEEEEEPSYKLYLEDMTRGKKEELFAEYMVDVLGLSREVAVETARTATDRGLDKVLENKGIAERREPLVEEPKAEYKPREAHTPGERRREKFLSEHPELAHDSMKTSGAALRDEVEFEQKPWHDDGFSERVNIILDSNAPTMTFEEILKDSSARISKFAHGYFGRASYKGRTVNEDNAAEIAEQIVSDVNHHIEVFPIAYRLTLLEDNIREGFLNDGRTKTLFETGRSHGSTFKSSRNGWERKIIDFKNSESAGGEVDLKLIGPKERPAYSMMGIPKAFESRRGEGYGESSLVLRDEVKDRSTFHLGNSSAECGAFTRGGASKLFEHDRDTTIGRNISNADMCLTGNDYLEVQTWGGVDLAKDVDHMVVAGSAWNRLSSTAQKQWMEISNKYGFDLKWRDGVVLHKSGDPLEASGSGRGKSKEDEDLVANHFSVKYGVSIYEARATVGSYTADELYDYKKRFGLGATEPGPSIKLTERLGEKLSLDDFDMAISKGLVSKTPDGGYKVKTSKFTYRYYDSDRRRIEPPASDKKSPKKIGDRLMRKDGLYEKTSTFGYTKIKDRKWMVEEEVALYEKRYAGVG